MGFSLEQVNFIYDYAMKSYRNESIKPNVPYQNAVLKAQIAAGAATTTTNIQAKMAANVRMCVAATCMEITLANQSLTKVQLSAIFEELFAAALKNNLHQLLKPTPLLSAKASFFSVKSIISQPASETSHLIVQGEPFFRNGMM